MANICPNCGLSNPEDHGFCARCGSRLPIQRAPSGPARGVVTAGRAPKVHAPDKVIAHKAPKAQAPMNDTPPPYAASYLPPPKPPWSTGKVIAVIVVSILLACGGLTALGLLFFGNVTRQVESSYSADLSVNKAEWKHEDPSFSFHTSRANYYLWVNVTVKNTGSSSLSISYLDFTMLWSGQGAGITGTAAWSSFSLPSAKTATLTIAYPSEGLKTPVKIDFEFSFFEDGRVQAFVPTPAGPAVEVTLTTISSEWKLIDTYGRTPDPDNWFLWLTFQMRNAWDEPISVNIFYFKAEGVDGSTYSVPQREGPDEIASGGTGTITLVFEVPETWLPEVLHYDMTFGPWADMNIPSPYSP